MIHYFLFQFSTTRHKEKLRSGDGNNANHSSPKNISGQNLVPPRKTTSQKEIFSSLDEISQQDLDENVIVLHKPSKNIININRPEAQVSLFFQKSNDLLHISLKDGKTYTPKKEEKEEKADVDPNLLSIEETMWKPINQPEFRDLPGYYLKLSKMRLTGKYKFILYVKYVLIKLSMTLIHI